MDSYDEMNDGDSSTRSNEENFPMYIHRHTQLTPRTSLLQRSDSFLPDSQLLLPSFSEHDSAPLSLASLKAYIGDAVSQTIAAREEMSTSALPSISSSQSGICGSKGDLSRCRYGDSSLASSSDECYSGEFPRPYTELIHLAFPDKLLAKALAEVARKRPENPIRYLAFYLKNHEENVKRHSDYASYLQAMAEYKKSLMIPEVESFQGMGSFGMEDENKGEEMQYEVDDESLPAP